MRIKEMAEAERPRERMMGSGPSNMSNGELISILLRTGIKGESAVEMAQRLLAKAGGSLTKLSQMNLKQFQSINGFGGMKALPIMAALELGRRFLDEGMAIEKLSVISPAQIFRMMKPALKGLTYEECWAVFLNSANYVISRERMSSGGLNSTVIDVKSIASIALTLKAVSVILVHNHPSGNPRPGNEDIRQTEILRLALSSLSISLVDHVVMCDDSYFSFADDTVYEG